MNPKGLLITFEGIDGSGKSTQAGKLADWFRRSGRTVLSLRDPGGTDISEQIRAILLSRRNAEMDALTELLLYESARAQIVEEKIRPAMHRGDIVIVDRFYDSTTAYQGYGRGLDRRVIAEANRIATGGLTPNLTFFVDVSLEEAERRRSRQKADRMEGEDRAFFNRIREGYLSIARLEPDRLRVIDGRPEEDVIAGRIVAEARKLLE